MKSWLNAALIGTVLLMETGIAAAQTGAAGGGDQDRMICRRMPETGSLVRTRRQCFTKMEWDRIAESARKGAERTVQELSGGFNGNN